MFLNSEQLRELTSRQRPKAQARALRDMGIKYGVRADGSIVVMVATLEKMLGAGAADKLARKTAPNFEKVA